VQPVVNLPYAATGNGIYQCARAYECNYEGNQLARNLSSQKKTMAEPITQTVSGTMPAIARDGSDVVLNWEARASFADGKETVHVHAWCTDSANNPFEVYQFHGTIISPQLGQEHGQFRSPLNVSDYQAEVATFDAPGQPIDVGLQVGMRLSEERNRDQDVTDVGNINFPLAASA
jgi:hypothetical protein